MVVVSSELGQNILFNQHFITRLFKVVLHHDSFKNKEELAVITGFACNALILCAIFFFVKIMDPILTWHLYKQIIDESTAEGTMG